MTAPRLIVRAGRWLCGLHDGFYLSPPIASGVNAREAFAEWANLIRLRGGV